MQPEPPTLRGLQPGSLHQTHSGLQPQFQTRRSQPAQLRAEPQHRPAPVQMYAVQPQPVSAPVVEPPRRLAQPAPALAPMPQAWSTFDDEAPFEPRRSGRGRHWLLGGMTAAGLLGSVVIGRLLLSSPTPATLAVETLPFDASVTIDGRPLPGTRSPYRAQDLQAGEHLLVVQKPGFVTHTERVSLREGEERRLATLVLSPNPPPAAIPSEPIAAAAPLPTDDATQPDRPRRRGRSLDTDEPRERPERSASARSSAREDEATRSTDSSAESDADERASKRRQSDDEPSAASDHSAPAGERLEDGMLRINSRPWAEVYVDGKRVGTTPQMGLRLRAGQHKVELINPELDMRKSVVVDIEPGELVTRIVTLQE